MGELTIPVVWQDKNGPDEFQKMLIHDQQLFLFLHFLIPVKIIIFQIIFIMPLQCDNVSYLISKYMYSCFYNARLLKTGMKMLLNSLVYFYYLDNKSSSS